MIKNSAIETLQIEADSIVKLIDRIDDEFEAAVKCILDCHARVVVTGMGKSGHIGRKIAASLASTGTPAFFMHPAEAFHGDLGMVTADDVVIAISNSGESAEVVNILPIIKRIGAKIIAMSGRRHSALGKNSDYFINIGVEREACPLGLAPTASTTATLAMGDAIACALMEVRHFKASDFALYHPGGSLGKKLLSKVKDYMVSTNLPIVSLNSKVSDTIIEISKTKQGIAIALEKGKIAGAVTDGDVRRAMQEKQDVFFNLTVSEIMSEHPKMVNQNAKLSEAEHVMRQYNIHSLVVIDDNDNLVGIIDSFSCML